MRFFSLVRFDLSYGIFRGGAYKKYWALSGLFVLACLEFTYKLKAFELTSYSYGDYLLYLFGGMKEYIPNPSEPFQIPYLWLLNHILILFFTLHYMHDDLTGFGQNMIYRSGSRMFWWLSKCIWNLVAVSLFYLAAWIVILIFSTVNGAAFSLEISSFMPQIMNFGGNQIPMDHWDLAAEITVLPLLTTMALSMLQMVLCLIVKPLFSYILSAVIFISSAYYLSPFLPGNYAMALRSSKAVTNGVEGTVGMVYMAFLIVASMLIGLCIVQKCDVLGRE